MTLDKETILERLAKSSWLRPNGQDGTRNTEVLNFKGEPMAPDAVGMEAYGEAGLKTFADDMREGKWRKSKFQPRRPFTMEEWEHQQKQKAKQAKEAAAKAAKSGVRALSAVGYHTLLDSYTHSCLKNYTHVSVLHKVGRYVGSRKQNVEKYVKIR